MTATVDQVNKCTQYIKTYAKKKHKELEQKAEKLIVAQTQIMSTDNTHTCSLLPGHPIGGTGDISEQRLVNLQDRLNKM